MLSIKINTLDYFKLMRDIFQILSSDNYWFSFVYYIRPRYCGYSRISYVITFADVAEFSFPYVEAWYRPFGNL